MSATWVELDLGILDANLTALRQTLGRGTELILLVKANAYGHGMAPVAQQAWASGVRWFAVAHFDEAALLRETLPSAQLVMIGPLDPADAAGAADRNILPMVVSENHAAALSAAASRGSRVLRCHAKVDTGMGRLGIPWDEAGAALPRIARLPGLDIRGMCTHFASADSEDKTFAHCQADRFRRVVASCEAAGLRIPFKHVSNSGAIQTGGQFDMDGVRPGILAYGYGAAPGARCVPTRPCLQWKTRVVMVKNVPAGFSVSYGATHVTPAATRLATIPAGYADGYSRLLGGKACVLIRGRRRPVVGRVTMNYLVADVGADSDVVEGDTVTLLGSDRGEAVWADEMAAWRNTIPYEVLTNIQTGERRCIPAARTPRPAGIRSSETEEGKGG